MLIRDRDDKERNALLKKYRSTKSIKRLSLQQIEFIKEEFLKPHDETSRRDIRMLDRVLKQLKFFKRFDTETRSKIFSEATLITMPGHTIIFNQGDVGDKLYVIIKGRVAV